MTAALSVEQLTVNYDKTPVLWDINFKIPEGKLVGIIGPNGAGKSTLLKAILEIVDPLSGKVEFFGLPRKKRASGSPMCRSALLSIGTFLSTCWMSF